MTKLVIKPDLFCEDPLEWSELHFFNTDNCNRSLETVREKILESCELQHSSITDVEKLLDSHTVWIPVYILRHSGDTVRSTPFACPWDSWKYGYMFYTKSQVRDLWDRSRITKKLQNQVTESLQASLKEYDNWLRGNIWYAVMGDEDTSEDSCSGFIGEYDDEDLHKEIAKTMGCTIEQVEKAFAEWLQD